MNRHSEMIKLYAKQLRLPNVVRYEEVLREASTTRWDYEAFLEAVLAAEVAQRQENQRATGQGGPFSPTQDPGQF